MLSFLAIPFVTLGIYGGAATVVHTRTDFCSDWGQYMNLIEALDSGTEWRDLRESDLEADPSLIECSTRQIPHYLIVAGSVAIETALDNTEVPADNENSED